MIQAIKNGSEQGMEKYIDFLSVRDSIKQQIDTSIEQNKSGDPLADSMISAFRPMIDTMVDELVVPDKLALFIKTGDLKSVKRVQPLPDSDDVQQVSWFAFFDRINRFRVNIDKLILYMELKDFQWKLVAIGSSDLLDLSRPSSKKNAEHIVDVIDENPSAIPYAFTDVSDLREKYKNSFFIAGDYGDSLSLEGDLFFLSSIKDSRITLLKYKGVDDNGQLITRDFTEEEKEEKARYTSFSNGRWNEKIPKINAGGVVKELKGRVRFSVPTEVESLQLNEDDKGQIRFGSVVAATLTELRNGEVGLSLYNPYDETEKEFIVICRNKKGQVLKTSGSSWMSSDKPITLPQRKERYNARSMTIRVLGTPHSIDVYYVRKHQDVSIDFVAYPKPEISFGELKGTIRKTRYAQPSSEPELIEVDKTDLKTIPYQYKQEVSYDGKERRYLHFILPPLPNTYFAEFDYSGLKLSLNNKNVDFKANKEHMGQTNFKVYFDRPNNEWGESVQLDKITGKVILRYPAKIEEKIIKQGEKINGVSLIKHIFMYPKNSSIPSYKFVWPVVSARAYDTDKREIALLESSGFWGEDNKIIFWGTPSFVEFKEVKEWKTLEIDIRKTKDDLIIVEK